MLGVKVKSEPEYSFIANAILIAYSVIQRSRVYVGQVGSPVSLSLNDILSYSDNFEIPCDKSIFVECIIAIDNIDLDEMRKRQKNILKPSK